MINGLHAPPTVYILFRTSRPQSFPYPGTHQLRAEFASFTNSVTSSPPGLFKFMSSRKHEHEAGPGWGCTAKDHLKGRSRILIALPASG
jgi:hypothetical protein